MDVWGGFPSYSNYKNRHATFLKKINNTNNYFEKYMVLLLSFDLKLYGFNLGLCQTNKELSLNPSFSLLLSIIKSCTWNFKSLALFLLYSAFNLDNHTENRREYKRKNVMGRTYWTKIYEHTYPLLDQFMI